MPSAITLRPYQSDGIAEIREAFRLYRAVCFQAPTGAGKTAMFTYITGAAAVKGTRVLILVHRAELLKQTSAALDFQGVTHGLIAPRFPLSQTPVQVASVQTLARRLNRVTPPGLIIVDEAHHAVAGTWRKTLAAFPRARVLGVTATPARLDGKGLGVQAGGVFEFLIEGPSVESLIADGYLSPYRAFCPPMRFGTDGLHTLAGDWKSDELSDRVDKPTVTGDAVEYYRLHCLGKPAIAFCVSVEHARHVADQFRAAGIPSGCLDGSLSDHDRNALTRGLESGAVQVLTSCEIVSEGYDLPALAAAILLRPTQSLGLYLQQVGRALRPAPGKDRAVILDHVGNVERHGLPDWPREWTLDGISRAKKAATGAVLVRTCKKCFAGYRATLPRCPECGTVPPVQSRMVDVQDGSLSEVTPELAERLRAAREARIERDAREVAYLEKLAERKGHKRGWAMHVFEARRKKREAGIMSG